MKFDNVCIEHFVEVTHTFRQGDKIGTRSISKEDIPAYSAYAKAHKPEIMEYLLKKEKQAEEDAQKARERQAKIESIEGLKELEAANEALLNYREAFNRAMESGDGILPSKPSVTPEDIEALCKQYPRAAAYRKAEAGSLSANYAKASAYKKALEKIINGEDCEKALADADAEWSAYCDEHIWD